MTSQASETKQRVAGDRVHPYDRWIESQGIPVYRAYHVDSVRTLELAPWALRGCDAAFLQLAGQEGVSAAYVMEIPPKATLEPFHMAVDEVVYVAQGGGLTTIWAEGHPQQTFEWEKFSIFLLPANYTYQLTNTSGTEAVRLMFTNGLPTAMAAIPNPEFFFNSTVVDLSTLYGEEGGAYSEARVVQDDRGAGRNLWIGNFFPNMFVWDKLEPFRRRGLGRPGRLVHVPQRRPRKPHVRVPGAHLQEGPSARPWRGHHHSHRRRLFGDVAPR